jgi:hypothetical protein
VAYDEKTLFDLVADDRIEVQRAFEPERRPHLIVLPSSSLDRSFRKAAQSLPPEVWRAASVVFDGSGEGPVFSADYVRSVQRFAAERGVPEARCAFVTQNRKAELPGSTIRILHYDLWIRRLFSWTPEEGEALFQTALGRFRAREPERPKRFVSLNLTVRTSKLLFLLALIRDGLWDQGHVSFGGFEHLDAAKGRSVEEMRARLLAVDGFEDLSVELAPYLPVLEAKGPMLFGFVRRRPAGFLRKPTEAQLLAEFDGSWFSATTETEMSAGAVDRITEKSLKALMNFQPQVILGNAGALARLAGLGFQGFSDWIDEAYDREPDPRRRFDMAYGEIRRLCGLDEAALARMERDCAERLAFNARHGFVRLPAAYRKTYDRTIVSELLSLIRGPAAAG